MGLGCRGGGEADSVNSATPQLPTPNEFPSSNSQNSQGKKRTSERPRKKAERPSSKVERPRSSLLCLGRGRFPHQRLHDSFEFERFLDHGVVVRGQIARRADDAQAKEDFLQFAKTDSSFPTRVRLTRTVVGLLVVRAG